MKRKITILTAIGIIFFSCSKKAPISAETMTAVLTDVMILEAGNNVQYNYATISNRIWSRDYIFACKKHKIDTAEFKKGMIWYNDNPEQFTKIIEQVINKLQRQQVELQKPVK